ncbi:protein of unknown function - conserved [Leishmania donovani]|uniref:Hypothetical_protein_conserved n=1 Tax=Leishmania donovani TaxID=5661 RepID=A0A6J8FCX5_LEIDO|nr:protein of unknown function - conserved [Leishmania donovani]VDZ45392.1 hypothetical_protein_conserved [Leishmania donovani]
MTATASNRAQAVAALKLQRDRSTTYQQWTLLFHRAITGDITATELQRNIQGIVLPEFQRISTQLRTLQKALTETAVETEQRQNGHPSPHSPAEAPEGPADNRQQTSSALAIWIDRLQDLEREHYTVTLSLANQLVEHCTPNVCLESESEPSTATEAGKAEEGTPKRTGEPADIKSLFKPDSSDDEQYELVERRPNHIAHSPPAPSIAAASAPAPAPATPTLRVHDVERCTLLRLIPPRYRTHLYFVKCRGVMDSLGGPPDHSANGDDVNGTEGSTARVEEELVALPSKGARRDEAPILAHYAPSAVACRCAGWSSAVASIIHRQESLRAAIEDLCEELQGEISDDA